MRGSPTGWGARWRALALAGPAEDRVQLVEFFVNRFPGVPLEDYVYGALIANPGGRDQYDQIMEFPPFLGDIEKGKRIWETTFHNGRSFADCFPGGGHNAVGNYPYFDETLGKVVSFENAINACLRANGEAEMAYGEREPMGVLTAYARTLSDGMRIDIRVDSPGAAAKYEAGRNLFFRQPQGRQRHKEEKNRGGTVDRTKPHQKFSRAHTNQARTSRLILIRHQLHIENNVLPHFKSVNSSKFLPIIPSKIGKPSYVGTLNGQFKSLYGCQGCIKICVMAHGH
jgi:hypothetical protein